MISSHPSVSGVSRQDTPGRADGAYGRPRFWPLPCFCAFAAACLAGTALVATGAELPPPLRWMKILLPLSAFLAAMASLSFRLPGQNIAAIGGIALLFSAAILGCPSVSGFPLGRLRFDNEAGPLLLGPVPVSLSLCWAAIVVSSRNTARLVMLPCRRTRFYGYYVVGLSALLAVITDLNLEPFGAKARALWVWQTAEETVCWYSAPWFNFPAWTIGTAVILAFSTPWFISKRPVTTTPRLTAALVWGALNLHFILGNAAHRLWLAVLIGAPLTTGALILAQLGARRARNPTTMQRT
jgi:uncharacterized membrane protein